MVIDTLLVTGVLLSLLSGMDLLLRPHQRSLIQDFLEDITVRSADLTAEHFAARIHEPGVQAVLVILTYFQGALMTALVLVVQAPQWRPGGVLSGHFGPQGRLIQTIAILLAASTLLFAWRWPLPQIMTWVLGGRTRTSMGLRVFGVVIAGYAFFETYQLLVFLLIQSGAFFRVPDSQQQTAMTWSVLPAWPLATVLWVVLQGTGLALHPTFWITRGLFALFRATLWRLIQYPKGAVGGLTVLLTTQAAIHLA